MNEELEDLLAEFISRQDSGEALDPGAFADAHPEMRDELLAALRAFSSTESRFPDTDRDTIAGYRLLEELGRGGMGRVVAAERDGQVFALKLLSLAAIGPRSLERLRREADALRRLDHPGIVAIHDYGEVDGTPFVAMEKIDGPSLGQCLASARRGDSQTIPLPWAGERSEGAFRHAARLVGVLARAVQAAHEAGLLHRDIKPGNVLLRSDQSPVLIDFGLAADETAATLTRTGDVLGTPNYMAPEQARGEPLDARADVYGLGAILYELVLGRPPHGGDDPVSVLHSVRTRPIPRAGAIDRRIPRTLDAVLFRCLAPEPGSRYADARSLAEDLEAFAAGDDVQARSASTLERIRSTLRYRRPQLLGTAAVALISLGIWASIGPSETEQREAIATALEPWIDGRKDDIRDALAPLRSIDPTHPLIPLLETVSEDPVETWPQPDAHGWDLLVRGARELREGRAEDAVETLAAATEALPNEAAPVAWLGIAARRAGDPERATRDLIAAARMLPRSAAIRYQLGRVWQQQRQLSEAEAAFESAVERDPEHPRAWTRLAGTRLSLYTASSRKERQFATGALEAARRSVAIEDSRRNRLQLAWALVVNEDFDAAFPIYQRHLERHPKDAATRYTYAMALQSAHRLRAALHAFEQVAAARPDSFRVHSQLAWIRAGSQLDCDDCVRIYREDADLRSVEATEREILLAIQNGGASNQAALDLLVNLAVRVDRTEALLAEVKRIAEQALADGREEEFVWLSKAQRTLESHR